MSKLKIRDLYPVVVIWLSNEMIQISLCQALHKVLHTAFGQGRVIGTFHKWQDFNIGKITEIATEEIYEDSTYLKNICIPLYDIILENESFSLPDPYNSRITVQDVLNSIANTLENYTTNSLRRVGLAEGFNVVNKNYYWRKVEVYK